MKGRPTCLLAALMLLATAAYSDVADVPFVDKFTGSIGLYAVTVDPGAMTLTALQTLELNPDDRFPLASSFKPFILYEVLRAIDDGRLDWKQRIDVNESDLSLDPGRPLKRASVRRLVTRMITVSHNTSADVLFKLVGLDAPSATLSVWGLDNVRVVLPTREFWLALSGLVPEVFPADDLPAAAAAYGASTRAEQIATANLLRVNGAAFDRDTLETESDDFYDFRIYDRATAFDILDDVDNVATPREMVRFS